MSKNISDTKLTETTKYAEEDIITGNNIGTWQKSFQLTALQFEYIKNGKSHTHDWAHNIFIAFIGLGLMILTKFIANLFDKSFKITDLEIYSVAVAFTVSIFLYILNSIFPSNHKKTIKKIQEHFDSSPEIPQTKREH